MAEELKQIDGETVLNNEAGTRFFHKHKSAKARAGKKLARRSKRRARRRNRK